MRHTAIAFVIAALAVPSLASAAPAAADLRGADAETSARRTRRDAAFLRAAGARAAPAPVTLRGTSADDLSIALDAWLRESRERPAPQPPAGKTPKPPRR